MHMPGEPVCTCIVFCDYVITDATSGKNSLIGTFPSLQSPKFPLTLPQFYIHTTISNFVNRGEAILIAVNLKNVQSGAVIASVGSPVTISPAQTQQSLPNGLNLNLNIPLQNVTFPSPGLYECEVLFNGDKISQRILEITLQAQGQQAPQNPIR